MKLSRDEDSKSRLLQFPEFRDRQELWPAMRASVGCDVIPVLWFWDFDIAPSPRPTAWMRVYGTRTPGRHERPSCWFASEPTNPTSQVRCRLPIHDHQQLSSVDPSRTPARSCRFCHNHELVSPARSHQRWQNTTKRCRCEIDRLCRWHACIFWPPRCSCSLSLNTGPASALHEPGRRITSQILGFRPAAV